MKLMRYNAGTPAWNFDKLYDDFFNRSLTDTIGRDYFVSQPSVNVLETDADYRIELAAPGLEKENFNVTVEDGFLYIAAEKKQEVEEKEGDRFTRREFNYASFQRRFKLPEVADEANINATYANGVLTVILPKLEEAATQKAKAIEVK